MQKALRFGSLRYRISSRFRSDNETRLVFVYKVMLGIDGRVKGDGERVRISVGWNRKGVYVRYLCKSAKTVINSVVEPVCSPPRPTNKNTVNNFPCKQLLVGRANAANLGNFLLRFNENVPKIAEGEPKRETEEKEKRKKERETSPRLDRD